MSNIFKILVVLGLINISLFGGSLEDALIQETSSSFTVIYWLFKFMGLGVIIWGVADFMSEDQGQENGGKYIKGVVKILVGGVFIGIESLAQAIGLFSNAQIS